MIRTIIFDIDETLYSYIAAHNQVMAAFDKECMEMFGWEQGELKRLWKESYAKARGILGYHNAAIHDTMLRFQFALETKGINPLPYAQKLHSRYWDCFIDQMKAEEGTMEFLLAMKRKGIRMGVATDMVADIQYRKLEKLGFLKLFDFIVSSEEVGYEKPHEKFFAACLEKAGCPADECLMVGDNWEKDISGALHAGMHAAWYRSKELADSGYGLPQYGLPAEYRVESGEPCKEKYLFSSYWELLKRVELEEV